MEMRDLICTPATAASLVASLVTSLVASLVVMAAASPPLPGGGEGRGEDPDPATGTTSLPRLHFLSK
jgi:hypothetical protein